MHWKNFTLKEFGCPCCGRAEMHGDFVTRLDRARDLAGLAFVVNSGFRCEENNRRVGGVVTSSHLSGRAADIRCRSSRERGRIVSGLLRAGFTRIGIDRDFVHVDDDPIKKPYCTV